MTKHLEQAPLLPSSSVDFNKLHDLVKKGDADAADKAVIEQPRKAAPKPAPEADKSAD